MIKTLSSLIAVMGADLQIIIHEKGSHSKLIYIFYLAMINLRWQLVN